MPSASYTEQGSAATASHSPAADSKAESTTDAGQAPAAAATQAENLSAPDADTDVGMESVDKGGDEGTAATGADKGEQAEPSKGDKTTVSTVQAEAPPSSNTAGRSSNQPT